VPSAIGFQWWKTLLLPKRGSLKKALKQAFKEASKQVLKQALKQALKRTISDGVQYQYSSDDWYRSISGPQPYIVR
jgi:hypothetical protein